MTIIVCGKRNLEGLDRLTDFPAWLHTDLLKMCFLPEGHEGDHDWNVREKLAAGRALGSGVVSAASGVGAARSLGAADRAAGSQPGTPASPTLSAAGAGEPELPGGPPT